MGIEQVADVGHVAARGRAADDVLPVERRQGEHAERRRRARGRARRTPDTPDAFTYDPMNPVLSYGGNVCCTGNAVQAGSFDQRTMEARARHPRLHVASRSRKGPR